MYRPGLNIYIGEFVLLPVNSVQRQEYRVKVTSVRVTEKRTDPDTVQRTLVPVSIVMYM